ncbi:MAG TPA: PilZ domain-containing protein [Sphingomicrobium sp.]
MSKSKTAVENPAERRRVERSALRLDASIREPGRGRVSVRLIDISTHGCRIEATSGPNPDSWVLLSITGLETQYCRVVWNCQEFAGLEFETPLAEAVLDRLLSDQKQLSEKTIGEMRSIATRTHRLATIQTDEHSPVLTEISRKMAVEALVEGLKLGESKSR